MTPTELTALVAAATALLASGIVPLYLRHQAHRQEEAESELVTFQSMTAEHRRDRDELRTELRAREEEYRGKIRELVADYDSQLMAAKARISHLESVVAELTRARGSQ